MSELKQWREMHIDCPVCGSNPVEIYTKGKEDNYGCENDEMRCTECGVAGYWTEGIFGWKMEVSNENALIKFYEENEALKARVAKLEDTQKTLYPDKCPITNEPFFMLIKHPELGWQPTYGGPYDSYTIPIMIDGSFHRYRCDHDEGGWVDELYDTCLTVTDVDEYACLKEDKKELEKDNARMREALEWISASAVEINTSDISNSTQEIYLQCMKKAEQALKGGE